MSSSAVRVRSSALYFVEVCRESYAVHRDLGTEARANLPQPQETPLVEWRHVNRAHRIDGKASWLGVGRGIGGLLSLGQRHVGAPGGLKNPCLLLSAPTTACSARCLCARLRCLLGYKPPPARSSSHVPRPCIPRRRPCLAGNAGRL